MSSLILRQIFITTIHSPVGSRLAQLNILFMKKWLACIASLSSFMLMRAQNIGVNTTNPQASLDVRGSQRVGGNNNYMQFDSATGRIIWTGAALYAPASQQIIRHSASNEGMYAGGGRLE